MTENPAPGTPEDTANEPMVPVAEAPPASDPSDTGTDSDRAVDEVTDPVTDEVGTPDETDLEESAVEDFGTYTAQY